MLIIKITTTFFKQFIHLWCEGEIFFDDDADVRPGDANFDGVIKPEVVVWPDVDDLKLAPEMEDFPDETDLIGDGGGSCEYRDLIGFSTKDDPRRENGFKG